MEGIKNKQRQSKLVGRRYYRLIAIITVSNQSQVDTIVTKGKDQ